LVRLALFFDPIYFGLKRSLDGFEIQSIGGGEVFDCHARVSHRHTDDLVDYILWDAPGGQFAQSGLAIDEIG
jgi:hypothetical protein